MSTDTPELEGQSADSALVMAALKASDFWALQLILHDRLSDDRKQFAVGLEKANYNLQ